MANDAVSSSQLDHSSSMLDFLKGTLKEVPRLYCLNTFAIALLLSSVCCIYSSARQEDLAAAVLLWRWCLGKT